MIPGLSAPLLETGRSVYYSVSTTNVDPWVTLGSPAYAIIMNVYVGTGAVVGSTTPASPSMLIRPYHLSTVNLFVSGKIGAAGGVGGGGDRGRMNGNPSSTFVGGGGGGGAGTNAGAGGARAIEPDSAADLASNGSAGTATTGGGGGLSVSGGGIPNSITFTAGSVVNLLARNPAILLWPANGHTITVNLYNGGSIFAGGDGGIGGYQDGSLPGGGHNGTVGEDLPAYYDAAPGLLTDHPAVGYRTGQVTLNWKSGNVHPSVKGRIIGFTVAP